MPSIPHRPSGPVSITRRGVTLSVPLLALAPKARALTAPRPVLDQPMTRLRLPEGAVGRDYLLLQLKVDGRGPYDFMVDTGLTAELITPHLRQALGIPPATQRLEQGFGAGGSVLGADLVQLKGAMLVGAEDRALPPLTAVVTDFLQEHLDPEHDPVEGMLGMEVLQMFDADFDFPNGRMRLWEPGEGVAAAEASGQMAEVPAAVLNETGVIAIRATSPAAIAAAGSKTGRTQPFAGILDCGASFSAINWQAAALAGLPPRGDQRYYGTKDKPAAGVSVLGVDGRPQVLPMTDVSFTFVGNASRAAEKGGGPGYVFEPPPPGWRPWAPVKAAVGDLPVFAQLLGDGVTPFEGPAALIGMDVLSQRRVVFGAGVGQRGRARRLLVSKA